MCASGDCVDSRLEALGYLPHDIGPGPFKIRNNSHIAVVLPFDGKITEANLEVKIGDRPLGDFSALLLVYIQGTGVGQDVVKWNSVQKKKRG